MAYTPSPETQTYSTHRLHAVPSIELRPQSTYLYSTGAISKDPGMVNMLTTKKKDSLGKETLSAYTRPALIGATIDATYTNRTPRGFYVWEKDSSHTYYFAVVDGRIYTSSNGTTYTSVQTITPSDAPVAFTEFISSTATKYLIVCDGSSKIYRFTNNSAPTNINLGFTSIPYIIYIDGYLFTAKSGTGDIYNCDLDDPTSWTGGSFISSELYPDDVKAIVKVNNYLLAIGTQGCEFFYDAANPTASPLARYQEGALPFGTAYPYTVAGTKNNCVLLANNNDGEIVLRVVENFKYTDVPCGWLMEYIAANVTSSSGGGGGHRTTASTVRGSLLRFRGDLYYVIATSPYLASYSSSQSSWINTPTFAFNFSTGIWVELRFTKNSVDYPFSFVYSSPARSDKATNYVLGLVNASSTTVVPCWATLDESGNSASTDNITTYQTDNIAWEVRTERYDFGTLNSKMMNRLGALATTATSNATASLNIQWSDDNYGTWTTARTVDVKDSTDFPFITQLGRFRQRAFRISYSGVTPIWFQGLEVDINKAQQ